MDEGEDLKGVIVSAQSEGGLMRLVIEDDAGKRHTVRGDNGPTVRALMAVFGSQIVENHALLVDEIVGQRITYGVDDFGLLAFIAPEEG